jgi:hypothetical protein
MSAMAATAVGVGLRPPFMPRVLRSRIARVDPSAALALLWAIAVPTILVVSLAVILSREPGCAASSSVEDLRHELADPLRVLRGE